MLILKPVTEILILWILYILYMGILVYRKGPLGGIFFYPKVVQDRVVTLGLITKEEIKKRRAFAYALLLAWMLIAPGVMILLINGVRGYFDLCRQFFLRFLVMLYLWKAFDIVCLDWLLLTKSHFFQHFYPETEGCAGYDQFGFNRKEQIVRIVVFPFVAAALAGICLLIG